MLPTIRSWDCDQTDIDQINVGIGEQFVDLVVGTDPREIELRPAPSIVSKMPRKSGMVMQKNQKLSPLFFWIPNIAHALKTMKMIPIERNAPEKRIARLRT